MTLPTEITLFSLSFALCLCLFSAQFTNAEDFLKLCIAGDKTAWDGFVQRYKNVIYSAINRTLNKYAVFDANDTSDEIFQNIFVKLHGNNYAVLRQFNYQAQFSTWLTTVTIRSTIDHLRRPDLKRDSESLPISEMDSVDNDTSPDPLIVLIDKLKKQQLEDAIKTLSSKEQLVIKYSLKGYNVANISNLMNDNENNISAIKHRAKTKLQKVFSASSE